MNIRISNSILLHLLTILYLIVLSSCKLDISDKKFDVVVGKGFLQVLPVDTIDFFFFINLGHMTQLGHIFPSDHGGFILTDHMKPVPVYSPADMTISRVFESRQLSKNYDDYGMTLSVNDDEFVIVFGHMSKIHDSIYSIAKESEEIDFETYNTAGDTYERYLYWTDIQISAGDTLGMTGGMAGQLGLDFGTFDKTKEFEMATDRFDGYLYPCTVSPLDYFTDEITQILIPICGDSFYGLPTVRTKPPIGGTIDYDIKGTAQGIWFKQGEPLFPEDPHMALVFHNVDPDVPIFSVGNSVTGLNPGPYTFNSKNTGFVDRPFSEVKPDGDIYSYNSWYHSNTPYGHMRLLLQMIDESHLKIEMQDTSLTQPWHFTNNAVIFDR